MKTKEFRETLRELMEQFNRTRELWIARFGNDDGHGEWFTGQVIRTGKAR